MEIDVKRERDLIAQIIKKVQSDDFEEAAQLVFVASQKNQPRFAARMIEITMILISDHFRDKGTYAGCTILPTKFSDYLRDLRK